MKLFALDASAWLRLFLGDGPLPTGLETAAAEAEQGNAAFVAPELILVEAAHALQRKVRRRNLTAAEGDTIWLDMQRMPLELLSARDHIARARALAGERSLSVYDALYLVVAEHLGVSLFTADTALGRAGR